MSFYVYIMSNWKNGALYVGVTNDLIRRAHEHKQGDIPGFTKRYGVKNLIHYEVYDDRRNAIQREKNIKHWSREWKIALIEKNNSEWRDLFEEIAA